MRVIDQRDGKSHFLIWTEELQTELDRIAEKYQCDHPKQELREFTTSNGGSQIKKQCTRCGAKTTNAIARSTVAAPVPPGSEVLADEWEAKRKAERDGIVQTYLERHLARDSQQRKQYDAYLLSPEWKEKREKVFNRADGICEGCLERNATQVHHLDYKNFMHEFMFQLVAVCDICHARIHNTEESHEDLPIDEMNDDDVGEETQF